MRAKTTAQKLQDHKKHNLNGGIQYSPLAASQLCNPAKDVIITWLKIRFCIPTQDPTLTLCCMNYLPYLKFSALKHIRLQLMSCFPSQV